MMSSLSTQPVSTWLPRREETDRQAMRDLFAGMGQDRYSGLG